MKPLDLNTDYRTIINCRICNSEKLQEVLDLGIQPLANNLRSLKEQTLEKNFPQTLILKVIEREPLGVFCSSADSEQVGEDCFLIDNNGVIFEPMLGEPSVGNTIVRQVGQNNQVFVGEKIISQNISIFIK
jgi:hypothetical protein